MLIASLWFSVQGRVSSEVPGKSGSGHGEKTSFIITDLYNNVCTVLETL